MTSIEKDLAGMKPWWDAPETREKATMCMVIASLAGQLRAFGSAKDKAEATLVLAQLSAASKIPLSVLSSYADATAALIHMPHVTAPANGEGKS
ncbi:hypothetical protein [Ralstonia solanacearum]|uniref:hypothetical protein n=1 Tax=Ralstonia solanacearum TaxID=305 RepID=UPI0018D0FA12|nr:hypothetical protein [Ralstonia solanacearum]